MPDAIVLGGGGTKGAFGAGALLRLYEFGIRPSIICGTSAGSLNALKLAEAPQDPTQPERIAEFWSQLRSTQDMYVPRDWMKSLTDDLRDLMDPSFQPVLHGANIFEKVLNLHWI